MDVMDEALEILRDDRVKELIEKTARYYYTSTAVNVDLTIPGIVVGLFLFGENIENTLGWMLFNCVSFQCWPSPVAGTLRPLVLC